MSYHFKVLVVEQVLDIATRTCEEIVDADDDSSIASKCSHRCEPRKPAPPDTSTRFSRTAPGLAQVCVVRVLHERPEARGAPAAVHISD